LLQAVAPDTLNVPAAHIAEAGVADVEPEGHAYPALQLVHELAPETLNLPGGQMAAGGVGVVEPDGHA
jgi:hypothetical protein